MTTRDDSHRLDTTIRNAVAFGGLPLTGRFEAAVAAVLDLHGPQPIDSDQPDSSQYCPSCIDDREDFADYPCPTIRALAKELRVSGEAQSEPTTAPREPSVWPTTVTVEPNSVRVVCDDEGDQWERDEDGLWHSDSAAKGWPWAALMHEFGPLTEVVTPEGTP